MLGLGAEFLLGMSPLGLVMQLGAGRPPRPSFGLPADDTPPPLPQRTVCAFSLRQPICSG